MDTMRIEPIVPEKEDVAHENQAPPACVAALCARIWEYHGPQEKLRELAWDADVHIAELIRSVATESHGQISPRSRDRKSTRLNSSHMSISYAVFCLKKKNINRHTTP